MAPPKYLVIHHSASGPVSAATIRRWHKAKGWSDVGYQEIIERSGKLVYGRSLFKGGAHCPPHNRNSIGICVVGDNRPGKHPWTRAQLRTLRARVAAWRGVYPGIKVRGHRDVGSTPTLCPGLDIEEMGL